MKRTRRAKTKPAKKAKTDADDDGKEEEASEVDAGGSAQAWVEVVMTLRLCVETVFLNKFKWNGS